MSIIAWFRGNYQPGFTAPQTRTLCRGSPYLAKHPQTRDHEGEDPLKKPAN